MLTARTSSRILLAAATLAAAAAPAATLYWDGATVTVDGVSGGGGGTWTVGASGWEDGATAVNWTDGDDAVFAGTAGTVTLGGPITLGSATFETAGYTISGNAITLGASSTFTTNANTTINSSIVGSNGFIKSGAGTLTLSGQNTYTGPVVINAGTLAVGIGTLSNWVSGTNVSTTTGSTLATSAELGIADLTASNFASFVIGGAWLSPAQAAAIQTSTFTNDGTTISFWAALYQDGFNKAVKVEVTKSGDDFIVKQLDARYLQSASILGSATFGTQISGGSVPSDASGFTYRLQNLALQTAGELGVSDVTLNGGTLSIGASNQTIKGLSGLAGSTVTGTGFLTVGSGDASGDFAGVITSDLTLDKVGTGTQVLSGANTYTGLTTIAGGLLRIGNATALGGTTLGTVVQSGATLDLNGQTVGAEEVNISGTGVASGGALISSAGSASTSGRVIMAAASSVGGAGNLTLSGVVSGAFALTKVGEGTLTLSVANSYSGGTVLSQGGIILGSGGALGSGTFTLGDANSGSSNLSLRLNSVTLAKAINVTANGTGTVTLGANGSVANPEFSGLITLNNRDVILDGSTTTDRMTFTGGITGTGNVTIAGTNRVMFLNGSNSFVGDLTVNAGAFLQLHWGGPVSTADYIPDASLLTVNGLIKIAKGNGGSETIGGLAGVGEIRSHEGVANVASTLVIGGSADQTFSGLLSNGGASGATLALVKNGAGDQTLSGSNTFTGGTTINAGTLTLAHASNTLADTGAVTVAGGTLAVVGNDTVGALTLTSGTISGAGTLTASSYDLQVGTVSANLGGSAALTKASAGTLTLSGSNTLNGGITVSDGILAASSASALSNGAVSVSGGTLSIDTAVSGASALSVTGGTVSGSGSLAAASFGLQAGTVSAELTGSGSLTKTGLGTATLSGTQTYSGATTVSNGTLELSGSLAGGSEVSVTGGLLDVSGSIDASSAVAVSGGILSVTGTVDGALTLASGGTVRGTGSLGDVTVADGTGNLVAGLSGSGTLTLGSLSFEGAGKLTVGNLADYLFIPAFSVTGELSAAGAAGAVSLVLPAGLVSNGTYQLISFGSTTATAESFSVTGPTIGARQSGVISLNEASSVLEYTVAGDSPIWTGANGAAFLGGNNWQLINGGTETDFIAGDALLLDDSALSTTVDISGADVAPGVLTFSNEIFGYTLSGTHGMASGSIVKSGAGDLAIDNANALESAIFSGGRVTLGAAGALGSASVTLSGGVLDLGGQSTDASIELAGGSLVGAGAVSGVLSGAGALAKSDAGTLALSGSNTYTGGTVVSAGVLSLENATDTLADEGSVTISGGELALGSNDDTVGALSLSSGSITGTGTLTAASLALEAGAVSAKLGGAAALVKSGAGTLTLSGANTYSGGTTVSSGTLAVGDDAALGSGSVALNGGTLVLSGQTLANALTLGGGTLSGSGAISGGITGSSALVKSGVGALTLSDLSGFSSAINVTSGSLVVQGGINGGTYTGAVSLAASTSLELANSSAQTLSGVISGDGALVKSGEGVLTLSRNNTFNGGLTVNEGTVNLTATADFDGLNSSIGRGNLTIAAGATVNANIFFSIGGVASAGNTKVVNVAGTLNMTGSEYVRTYNLTGGIINAPTATNDYLRASTSGLDINSLASATSSTITGKVDLTFNSLVVNTADGAAADDLVISGVISQNKLAGSGAKTLTKNGEGRLVLSGANAYYGATTINAGTLAVVGSGGLYRGAFANAVVTIGSGSTLEVQNWGYNESTASLGGLAANATSMVVDGGTIRVAGTSPTSYGRGVTVNSGGATLEAGAGASWTIDTVNDSAAWVFNGNPSLTLGGAGTGDFQKVIALGSGALFKVGEGTWVLSGANSYTGGTTVSAGTLSLGNVAALGTGDVTLLGGVLDLNGLAVANTIRFSGGTLINVAAEAPAVAVVGNVTSEDINNLPGSEVILGDDATVDLSGVTKTVVLSGSPTLSNLGSFAGTLAVGGAVDFSGAERPSAATLELRAGGSLDFGSANAFSGTVVYKGGAVQGSAFTGTLAVSGAGIALSDADIGAGNVVVGDGASVNLADYTGALRLTGTGAVSAGLSTFAGSLELADGAELNLTSSDAPSARVMVADGGVLAGSGSLGDVILSGGTLAPGNSPGIQNYATLTLEGGALLFEILTSGGGLYEPTGGTDYDTLAVAGLLDISSLSLANRLSLTVISLLDATTPGDLGDFDPAGTYAFDLITYGEISPYGGPITDYFDLDTTGLTFGGTPIDATLLSLVDTGTSIQLQYAPIPEPSTYGLMLGGLALAGAALRRRKRHSK